LKHFNLGNCVAKAITTPCDDREITYLFSLLALSIDAGREPRSMDKRVGKLKSSPETGFSFNALRQRLSAGNQVHEALRLPQAGLISRRWLPRAG
jgi:hypothetical protein